jgi:hypothetical protein
MFLTYKIVRPSLRLHACNSCGGGFVRSEREFYGHDTDECYRQAVRWLDEWKDIGNRFPVLTDDRRGDILYSPDFTGI